MRRRRKNPTTVPVYDAVVLIGIGVVVGGVAYFLYTKSQANALATADSGGPQQVPGASPGVVNLGPGGTSGGLPLGQESTQTGPAGA
jgi:hypothetical protein